MPSGATTWCGCRHRDSARRCQTISRRPTSPTATGLRASWRTSASRSTWSPRLGRRPRHERGDASTRIGTQLGQRHPWMFRPRLSLARPRPDLADTRRRRAARRHLPGRDDRRQGRPVGRRRHTLRHRSLAHRGAGPGNGSGHPAALPFRPPTGDGRKPVVPSAMQRLDPVSQYRPPRTPTSAQKRCSVGRLSEPERKRKCSTG